MKRKDIIYGELARLCEGLSLDELMKQGDIGYEADHIGANVGIARNTVSKELTELCREGLVIKIKSRPVRYLDKKSIQDLMKIEIDDKYNEVNSFEVIRNAYNCLYKSMDEDASNPFLKLIGYDKSLKNSIEKVKAAVIYPPNGLNILLSGESGVGKTYFAKIINEFAQAYDIIPKDKKLVYFNCSEYYNNPELLTAHIFGYTEGAFTGAISEKEGIVKQADGGFLFLDEVYRLTSEGQEKLFSLMDSGTYKKLGSTDKEEKVNVRLICATTEDIKSVLLKTFLRRIQVVVKIPSLKEKTIEERLELILAFFQYESKKINMDICIDYNHMCNLLLNEYEGNIGELKNEIQFSCAQAYLKKISSSMNKLIISNDVVTVKPSGIDIKVKEMLQDLFKGEEYITVSSENNGTFDKGFINTLSADKETDIFYSFLSKEYNNLRNSKISSEQTVLILKNKLENIFHFDLQYNNREYSQSYSDVGYRFEDNINNLVEYMEGLLSKKIESRYIVNLKFHILSLISLSNNGVTSNIYNLGNNIENSNYNNTLVKKIVKRIEDIFGVRCPNTEIVYMNLFINEFMCRQDEDNSEYGVVLISHGTSTATSMADYVNSLFDRKIITPIDMPINQSVQDTLDCLVKFLKKNDFDKIILLVDIGSLVYFGDVISRMFNKEVLLIKNINMLALMEIVRCLIYDNLDFDKLLMELDKIKIEHRVFDSNNLCKCKVIIVSCITGIGTSVKIKNILEETLRDYNDNSFRICVVDYKEAESIERLSKYTGDNERIAGVIGTYKSEYLDIPFISLEQLFSEAGIRILISILDLGSDSQEKKQIYDELWKKLIKDMTLESIIDHVTFLNPNRIVTEISEVYDNLCEALNIAPSQEVLLRFLIHCSCMVERLVVNRQPIQYDEYTLENIEENEEMDIIKREFKKIEETYMFELSKIEAYYIYELLFL